MAADDLLHVALLRECNTQQNGPGHATFGATAAQQESLKASSLLVLARNKLCNSRATGTQTGTQQSPAKRPYEVALTHGDLKTRIYSIANHYADTAADIQEMMDFAARHPEYARAEFHAEAQRIIWCRRNVIDRLRAIGKS